MENFKMFECIYHGCIEFIIAEDIIKAAEIHKKRNLEYPDEINKHDYRFAIQGIYEPESEIPF